MSFTRKKFSEGITYHESDWDDLQNNIGDYYDALLVAMQGQIDGILTDYLTSAHRTEPDPHPDIDMDYVKQGTAYIKLSAAEYAKFLTGFYDILDQTTTVKFGQGRSIVSFYFANGSDADGANIYANDLFSRGNPVYTLVYESPWHQLTTHTDTGSLPHGLGYRPSFGIMHVCITDPTGQPEEYLCTESYAHGDTLPYFDSYGRWNNTYYRLYNHGPYTLCFKLFLFAYLGS